MNKLTQRRNRAIRAMVGAPGHVRVTIDDVDPYRAPVWEGNGWYYTTVTGRMIQHPAAYARKGWSGMVYHCSTHEVIVGRAWTKAAPLGFGSMCP
jgi:hypothetical protein